MISLLLHVRTCNSYLTLPTQWYWTCCYSKRIRAKTRTRYSGKDVNHVDKVIEYDDRWRKCELKFIRVSVLTGQAGFDDIMSSRGMYHKALPNLLCWELIAFLEILIASNATIECLVRSFKHQTEGEAFEQP